MNSGKNSYRAFDLKSKKPWKFIKPFFENHKYRCQGALLTWFQKSEKMDFTWYLFKKRSYDLIDVWKKNLWSFRIFTWNIFLFELKLTKILTTRIVSFFFRPHSSEKKGKIHFFAENWKWVFYMSYKVSVSETDIFPVTTNVFACSYDQNWFLRKKLKFMCCLGSALGPRSARAGRRAQTRLKMTWKKVFSKCFWGVWNMKEWCLGCFQLLQAPEHL